MTVTLRLFGPADYLAIDIQDSQADSLGIYEVPQTLAGGKQLEMSGPAWTGVDDDGTVIFIAGFAEVFYGRQATAWAYFSRAFRQRRGAQRDALRIMRAMVAAAPFVRIEALCDAEFAEQARWLHALGFSAVACLRQWGPHSKECLFFERVK